MAAHVPRRVFARSFVITIAALPACGGPEKPVEPPTTTTTTTAPSTTASTSAATPTATATATPPTDPGMVWQIIKGSAAGTCMATVDMTCAPDESCNPPRPSDYACPKEVSLPFKLTRAPGAQECTTQIMQRSVSTGVCPRGAICNPPRPTLAPLTLPCPK